MLKLFEHKWFCTLALVFTSVAWGASFFIIKNAVKSMSTDVFIISRLLISALIFFIFFSQRYIKASLVVKKRGFLLGVVLFLPLWLQTLGLETISSGRSSFLTSLYVPFTPIIFWLITKSHLKKEQVILAIIAVSGSFLMNPFGEFNFSKGDYITILSAFIFALHIAIVGLWTKQHDSFDLGLWQFIGCLAGALFLLVVKPENKIQLFNLVNGSWDIWAGILYTSIVTTCICFTLQVLCQRHVEPHRAALIFALEAPVAVIFAFIFNQEKLTFNEIIGGSLIIVACILPEKYLRIKKYGPF